MPDNVQREIALLKIIPWEKKRDVIVKMVQAIVDDTLDDLLNQLEKVYGN